MLLWAENGKVLTKKRIIRYFMVTTADDHQRSRLESSCHL